MIRDQVPEMSPRQRCWTVLPLSRLSPPSGPTRLTRLLSTQIMHFKCLRRKFYLNNSMVNCNLSDKPVHPKGATSSSFILRHLKPQGLANLLNLLCCRALEVPKYVCVPSASHLLQTCELHNLGSSPYKIRKSHFRRTDTISNESGNKPL